MKKGVMIGTIVAIVLVVFFVAVSSGDFSGVTGSAIAKPICEDSDGSDLFNKGEITLTYIKGGKKVIKDTCSSKTKLREALCYEGVADSIKVTCSEGCLDGACIAHSENTCIDTDDNNINEGVNFKIRGIVQPVGYDSLIDYCSDTKVLVEYSCDPTSESLYIMRNTECPKKCKKGVAVNS